MTGLNLVYALKAVGKSPVIITWYELTWATLLEHRAIQNMMTGHNVNTLIPDSGSLIVQV